MKITVVLFIIFHSTLSSKDYSNYTLFRSFPFTEQHLQFLKNLYTFMKVDYWRPPGLLRKPVDILIAPEDNLAFRKMMSEKRYYFTTMIEDVQRAFDMQSIKPYIRRKMDSYDWKNFFGLKDTYDWLNDLAATYPEEVTILHLGETEEKRKILGVKVRMKNCRRRSVVMIEGGIHAREWISPAVVTYFLHQLLLSGSNPASPMQLIGLTYEFVFIPVANPDGYEYTINKDRMWRKNRRGGYGVDVNRNFDVGFGTTDGISFITSKETYCGEKAFSEKESQAIKKLVDAYKDDLEYYLAFHSYGQYMIIPYAHLSNKMENYDEVNTILQQAKRKLEQRYGTTYSVGTALETVGYRTSGVSGCWVKMQHRVPYVVTFELRDSGYFGFALPPSQILPTCEETLDALITILFPKPHSFRKLGNLDPEIYMDKQECRTLDRLVMFFNILFFIFMRFY